MNDSQRLNFIIDKLGLPVPIIADIVNVSKELLYMILSGKRNISKKLANKIQDRFGIPAGFSLGEGDRFDYNLNLIKKIDKQAISNAKDVGPARSDEDGDTKFTEISPGFYGMMVELVPEYAKAGYLSSYADQEFIDDLPKHYFTVDKFVRGKYRAFEVTGDSMNNGDIDEAIPNGAIVLARELKREAWRSKLHNHTWPNWIFVHRHEGIICKQIAHQDVQNGVLTLRSLNPDKDKYPDITVNMDELEQIYNVILRQLR